MAGYLDSEWSNNARLGNSAAAVRSPSLNDVHGSSLPLTRNPPTVVDARVRMNSNGTPQYLRIHSVPQTEGG